MSKHIVFIHGMWGTGWSFDNIVNQYAAQGYTCHTPVLRHHTSTTQPHPELSGVRLNDYVDDLTELIQGLDEKPIILGHSMGGLIAQKLAAKGLAKQLILVTPATPHGVFATTFSVLKTFFRITLNPLFWLQSNKISSKMYSYSVLNCVPKSEHAAIYEHIGYESGMVVFEMGFWPMDVFKKGSKVDTQAVTCPTLIVSAKEDNITPNVIHRRLAKRYPQAELKEYAGHGHWILGEADCDVVVQNIVDWSTAQ